MLDLFAGSGAPGIEALSRGAGGDVRRRGAGRGSGRAEPRGTDLSGGTVVRSDAVGSSAIGRYDLVFADPPYTFNEWPALLVASTPPSPGSESDHHRGREGWEVLKVKRYGGTVVTLAQPPVPAEGSEALVQGPLSGLVRPVPQRPPRDRRDRGAPVRRASIVAAIRNPQKGEPLFYLDEREDMIDESVAHLDNVEVRSFSSLVVDVAREVGADFIVKGLRAVVGLRVRAADGADEPRRLGRRTPRSSRSRLGALVHRVEATSATSPASAATCRRWCPRRWPSGCRRSTHR